MLNYARLAPVYLSQMLEIKETDTSLHGILYSKDILLHTKLKFNFLLLMLVCLKGIANNQE